MTRQVPLRILITTLLLSSASFGQNRATRASGSPFMPGQPLEPWTGPLPTAANSPVVGLQGFQQPSAPTNRWPDPPPAPAQDKPVPDDDDDPPTYVAATFNPALMTFGKTSGRLELAPLAAHALFLEVSRLSLFIDDVGRTVKGTEFDVGYHLFPQGKGAHGFYLGPRYLFGSGEIPEASWEFKGVGGDLGYQWVIARHLVFNLGAGVARINGKAEVNEDVIGPLDEFEDAADAFRSLSSQEQAFWVPMVTLGLGLAI